MMSRKAVPRSATQESRERRFRNATYENVVLEVPLPLTQGENIRASTRLHSSQWQLIDVLLCDVAMDLLRFQMVIGSS